MKKLVVFGVIVAVVLSLTTCEFLAEILGGPDDWTDDEYEENDRMSDAILIGINSELAGVQGDEDWYKVYVSSPGQILKVRLSFVNSEGDIDLELYDDADRLDASVGTGNYEEVSYLIGEAGFYHICVFLADEGSDYTLTVEYPLVDDPYEENNSPASATPVAFAQSVGAVQIDADYFRVDTPLDNMSIQASLSFEQAGGNLALEILDSAESVLGSADSTSSDESLEVSVGAAGDYYIRVSGSDEGNAYELWLTADDAYEDNDSIGWSRSIAYGRTYELVKRDEDWFDFEEDTMWNRVYVTCSFSHAEGNIDLEVYDLALGLTPRLLTSAESTDDNESVSFVVANAGYHFIRVYGADQNDMQFYELEVDLDPPE
mgnify:CR=1 FL=1